MANVDRPNGFKIMGTLSGSPWQGAVRQYTLDATHAAIAVGDLVQMTADGYVDILAAGETQMLGVVVGVGNHYPGETLGKLGEHFMSTGAVTLDIPEANYVALNTAGVIHVCVAPDVVLEAQEDGDTDPLELADVGQNVEIVGGGPDSTTGISDMMIDSDTHNTTNTLPLRILGLAQRPDNEYVSGGQAYTRWLVTPANHTFKGLNVAI